MELLDARWPAGSPRGMRLVAHPDAPLIDGRAARRAGHARDRARGRLIAREVETFVARGFAPVSLGSAILRVESAIAAALGQLVMLERLRER
ncbi:MAG: 16S rRNA (uracil(1498)-N(3))-methyltransferase [Kofleriaceae bacterium]